MITILDEQNIWDTLFILQVEEILQIADNTFADDNNLKRIEAKSKTQLFEAKTEDIANIV